MTTPQANWPVRDVPASAVDAAGRLNRRGSRGRTHLVRLGLYTLLALAGVVAAYWPTWRSGFTWMQADRGDTLHINYVLEHQLGQLLGWERPGTYWSPAYFYPQPKGLAYSENLLGTLPVYAAARALWSPLTAFQVWGMAMLVANFAAMTWSLRRFGVRPWLAAAGGFVFAFCLTRAGHLNHQHMLPQFAAPIAVWATVRWLEQPRLRYWLAAGSASAYQALSSLHLGWFLGLALTTLIVVRLLLEPHAVARFGRWLWRNVVPASVSTAAIAGVLMVLLWPYVLAQRSHGPRDDFQVTLYGPRLGSWLAAPSGTLPSLLGLSSDKTRPAFWEHELFLGMVPIAGGALALTVGSPRRRRDRSRVALVLSAMVLVALSLYVPWREPGAGVAWRDQGLSLWWWVWDWVPGANSIRAVGRVWSGVLPLLLIGAWLGFERWLRRAPKVGRRHVLVAAAMALALVEQVRVGPHAFDKKLLLEAIDAWRAAVPADCRVVYFTFPPTTRPFVYQTRAMWAALAAGKPTVNSYTSNYPPGYPSAGEPASREAVAAWMARHGTETACYVDPGGPFEH